MDNYNVHYDYSMKYDGRVFHNDIGDRVVGSTTHDSIWNLICFNMFSQQEVACPELLSIHIRFDICDTNNKFIMSTTIDQPMHSCGAHIYENNFKILVPKLKENKDED